MSEVTFDTKGLKEIFDRIEELGRNGARIENKAIKAGAEPMKEAISETVPVSDINDPEHTHIRDDIVISRIKGKSGGKYVEVGPSKQTAWRAKFLEYGTIKMAPIPFMETSFLKAKEDVQRAIKGVIKEELKL